jgi:hypothetical protein
MEGELWFSVALNGDRRMQVRVIQVKLSHAIFRSASFLIIDPLIMQLF